VLGSALWHLILLYPALKDDSEFVRWHGRQALLLAGVRTAVPLVCGLGGTGGACLAVLIQIPIYFVGNLWGQRQATRGDCTLMRRFGRQAGLPPPEPAAVAEQAKEVDPEALVDIIRYSRDPEERGKAVLELYKLGMVESLDHAPAGPPIAAPLARTAPPISIHPPATVRALPKWKLTLFFLGVGAAIVVIALLGYWAPLRTRSNTATAQRPPEGSRSRAVDYRTQGLAHYAQGEYEKAIADYTGAIHIDPSYMLAYQSRGHAYRALGKYKEAIADYRRAIRLNPDYATAHSSLAWTMAYHLDTNYEHALEHALRAVELDPSALNHDTLGLVYYKLEQYDEALEHYSLALSLKPMLAPSYRGRGDVYVALGDYQAALDDYQRYLALQPEAPDREDFIETIEWLQTQAE
jgi:Tfp pilus assembly protein PilF